MGKVDPEATATQRERKDRKALGLQHEQNPERISAGGDDWKETQHLTGDRHAEAHGRMSDGGEGGDLRSGEETWGRHGNMGSPQSIGCEEEKEEAWEVNQSTSLPKAGEHLLLAGSLLHLHLPRPFHLCVFPASLSSVGWFQQTGFALLCLSGSSTLSCWCSPNFFFCHLKIYFFPSKNVCIAIIWPLTITSWVITSLDLTVAYYQSSLILPGFS